LEAVEVIEGEVVRGLRGGAGDSAEKDETGEKAAVHIGGNESGGWGSWQILSDGIAMLEIG
jgi:hypothetical protein